MFPLIDRRMAEIIFRKTGLTIEQIRSMPIEEVHAAIEKKIGHKLTYGLEPGIRGRFILSEEIDNKVYVSKWKKVLSAFLQKRRAL